MAEAISAISTVETNVFFTQAPYPSKQRINPKLRSLSTTVGEVRTGCEERTNSDDIDVIDNQCFYNTAQVLYIKVNTYRSVMHISNCRQDQISCSM